MNTAIVVEILALLIVVAMIGYATGWLFYKSVCKKQLKVLESEKHKLNNRIVDLDGEIADFQKSLDDLDHDMEKYFSEHLPQHKQVLDYNSIGKAKFEDRDDLTMISGIGPVIEKELHDLEIYTFRQISRFTPQDIQVINDFIMCFPGRIERDEWVAQAIELVQSEEYRIALFKRINERKNRISFERIGYASREESDDLTLISGINGWIRAKLNMLDIYTFRQISNFNQDDIIKVTEAIEYCPGMIERDEWIDQAAGFVRIACDKASLLKRKRERGGNVYYERPGVAHEYKANNLTVIDVLGLWVEEKINALDISAFEQVRKLTQTDIETIAEVLEIKPERIEMDNWVGQARELVKQTA